jgi:hypothetical protein
MAVREWIADVGAKTAYIERGSPWRTPTVKASTRSSVELETARAQTVSPMPGRSGGYLNPLASFSSSRPFSKCSVARFGRRAIAAGRQSLRLGSSPN